MAEIHPIARIGAWEFQSGYARRAARSLEKLEAAYASLQALRPTLRNAKSGLLRYVPIDQIEEVRSLIDATIVFSAMAVESAVNFYGVVRLGEQFYSANFERLSPAQKVAALAATCTGRLLERDSEILKVVRALFGYRNELVHPKTRELTESSSPPTREARVTTARDSVAAMNRFFELFYELDPEAKGRIMV